MNLCLFVKLFSAAIPEEGKFGLQDFNQDVTIHFSGHNLQSVSTLHQDIYAKERDLKAAEKGSVNFLLAKLGIYKSDGTHYEQGIPLHEIMNEQLLCIFHSASSRDIASCCTGCNVAHSEVQPLSIIEQSYQNSAAQRKKFPGINEEVFKKQILELKEIETQIQKNRSMLAYESSKYVSLLPHHNTYKRGDLLEIIEKGIQQYTESVQKEEKKHAKTLNGNKGFFGTFWHSEPRLLHLLHDNNQIPAFLRGIARPIKSHVTLLLLHIHSTHDICDNCRLQFTGAMYKWLYERITSFFKHDNNVPIFHLVVSWHEPYNGIDFKNEKNENVLNINDVATIEDIKKPFDETTKPFVSIIKLSPPAQTNTIANNESALIKQIID